MGSFVFLCKQVDEFDEVLLKIEMLGWGWCNIDLFRGVLL